MLTNTGCRHDFRSVLNDGLALLHATPPLVAATTSRQLVAAPIRVRTTASVRAQGDKRGDNRQNLIVLLQSGRIEPQSPILTRPPREQGTANPFCTVHMCVLDPRDVGGALCRRGCRADAGRRNRGVSDPPLEVES